MTSTPHVERSSLPDRWRTAWALGHRDASLTGSPPVAAQIVYAAPSLTLRIALYLIRRGAAHSMSISSTSEAVGRGSDRVQHLGGRGLLL